MIGAVIAMQSEADILLNQMKIERELTVSGKQVFVGRAFGKDVALCLCGIGKVNAALGTQVLVSKFGVEKLVNFGVAGGLNDGTKLCQVYQIEAAVQFDFDLTQLNGTKMGTLDEYQENYLNCNQFRADFPKKRLGTADRFNDSVDDYKLLTEELKADIRDMEGCAVVQAAYCAQLPVFMMKAISDVAGSGNTAEQYFANKTKALENLSAALPTFFEEL
jgi:adenosylhomocysteine nucleosidase